MTIEKFQHYQTGLPVLDSEHWNLIESLNHLCRCKTVDESKQLTMKFVEAWQEHHAAEEYVMAQLKYPYAKFHKEQHAALHSELNKLSNSAFTGGIVHDPLKYYAEKLIELLLAHMDQMDQQFCLWQAVHPQSFTTLGASHYCWRSPVNSNEGGPV